jgi:hypothetical protein
MSNSVTAGAMKKYLHTTTDMATKLKKNRARIGRGPGRVGLGHGSELPKEQALDQNSDRDTQAIAEKEVPIAAHGAHHVEGVTFHRLLDGDLFRSVSRLAKKTAYGMPGRSG